MNDLTGHIDNNSFLYNPHKGWNLYIEGWVFHKQHPISKLEILLNEQQAVVTRKQRPDVAEMIPEYSYTLESGFEVSFPIESIDPENTRITMYAELSTGETLTMNLPITPREIAFEGEVTPDNEDTLYGSEEARYFLRKRLQSRLQHFLLSDRTLEFTVSEKPAVSVILVLFNQADFTFACLESLIHTHTPDMEVIIVDNNSSDETTELLKRIQGATLIHNEENVHFLLGANQGAAAATGEHLLFLNNDTEVQPDAITNALQTIFSDARIGAVGGKIIRPDGSLQEAGSYILRTGATFGFGVGDDPFSPRYNAPRDVDYVSGAFLLTPKTLFEAQGGFCTDFAPAYFEDVDYCLTLIQAQYRVVFDPRAVLFHYEKGSSSTTKEAEALTQRNLNAIRKRHNDYLTTLPYPPIGPSQTPADGRTIIVIDNAYPIPERGQGYPRMHQMIQAILDLGYHIIHISLHQDFPINQSELPDHVTHCPLQSEDELEGYLNSYASRAAQIIICRSPNLERFSKVKDFIQGINSDTRIIYDSEAIFADREIGAEEILRNTLFLESEKEEIIRAETTLAVDTDIVLTVCEKDVSPFKQVGCNNIEIIPHVVIPTESNIPFENRADFLFVGPLIGTDTPNVDGMSWFLDNVFPKVREQLSPTISLTHAGDFYEMPLKSKSYPSFHPLGRIEKLEGLYDRHRVFIAPIRFSAGIPLKVVEAAAAGIPVVTTSLLCRQLGWNNEVHLLVADEPEEFARCCVRLYSDADLWNRIRSNALEQVSTQFSKERFIRQIRAVFPPAEAQCSPPKPPNLPGI